MLSRLDIAGAAVTIDVMGCQKKIAEQIKRQGGDYLLGLKGNQGTLHDDELTFFTSSLSPAAASVSYDGEHGRIETRTIRAMFDMPGCKDDMSGKAYKALSRSRPNEKSVTRSRKKRAILSAVSIPMIRSDWSGWCERIELSKTICIGC